MSDTGGIIDTRLPNLDTHNEQPETTLVNALQGWLNAPTTPIIACGMTAAGHTAVPCPVAPAQLTQPDMQTLHLIPGISQSNPADIMHGEETQIAGFLALNPGWDGVICLPGTHTKWVHISANEIVSFQTFITGELFSLLSTQSTLRHSVDPDGWNDAAFTGALNEAMARPERLAARLFSLRAENLLNGQTGAHATARLSGLLIGVEMAAAKPYWLGQQVAVIGEGKLAGHYVNALAQQSTPATQVRGEHAVLAGLSLAYKQHVKRK